MRILDSGCLVIGISDQSRGFVSVPLVNSKQFTCRISNAQNSGSGSNIGFLSAAVTGGGFPMLHVEQGQCGLCAHFGETHNGQRMAWRKSG
jgi:hypothetical protein